MKNKSFFLLLACCLFATKFYGQQQAEPVSISYEKSNTNDTIWLVINTAPDTKPGSLMLVASTNLTDEHDTSFYPVIDSSSMLILAVPAEYQSGILHLQAYFYPEIFQVSGKVLSKVKNKTVNALLITSSKRIYNKALKLTDDKTFKLPGFIFEKQGSLIFKYAAPDDKNYPDVSIEQFPTAKNFTDMVFNQPIALAVPVVIKDSNSPKPKMINRGIPSADSTDKFKILNNVTVKGQRKSRAEKFNEEFSTGLFQEIDEKVVDVMDNPQAASFPDCLSYLRSQIPGLTVSVDKFGDNYVEWRGHETKAFFIDEIPVDIDQILSMNVADIAIIKAYPPPYSGGLGTGDGGGIAIYTRRGEYKATNTLDNKWLFSIKGYSSPNHTLFSNK